MKKQIKTNLNNRRACDLRVFLKPRAVISVISACLVGYLIVGFGVFLFVKYQRGIAGVRYRDICLPTRWSNYRVARGEYYIIQAQALLAQGSYQEALPLLRLGLHSAPSHRRARLALAQLYLDFRRPDLARTCLQDGLHLHQSDPDYLSSYLNFLFNRQQDGRVLAICRELLPLAPAPTVRDRLLALAAATACYNSGNYDQAEDYIRIADLQHQREGRLLSLKIDWDRGYHALALLDLRAFANEHPDDPEVYAELNARLRASDQSEEARRLSVGFQIAHPMLARPRIDLLRAYLEIGERSRAAQEIDALIRDFPNDSNALLTLADYAANSGDAALATRIYDHARSHRLETAALAFLMVEAHLVGRDFATALSLTRTLLSAHPDREQSHRPLFNSLQAIAHYGLGDRESGDLFLANFLTSPTSRAENLLAIADRLLSVSATDSALRLLTKAIDADPLNQAALARLVSLELNLHRTDKIAPHLRQLLTMRRPSPDILRVALHELGSNTSSVTPDPTPLLAEIRAHLAAADSRIRIPR
ncbi:MAG: tetratricopeptide repeat protein [Undibacterium sp.]|nr:tetratricopeptide repeat protein [Opitutaceae bacterium]